MNVSSAASAAALLLALFPLLTAGFSPPNARSYPRPGHIGLATSTALGSTETPPPPLPDTADPFVLLGLADNASSSLDPSTGTGVGVGGVNRRDIKRAYKRMASMYHPDALVSKDRTAEDRKRSNDDLMRINAAYEALTSKNGERMPGVSEEDHERAKNEAWWRGGKDTGGFYEERQWWEVSLAGGSGVFTGVPGGKGRRTRVRYKRKKGTSPSSTTQPPPPPPPSSPHATSSSSGSKKKKKAVPAPWPPSPTIVTPFYEVGSFVNDPMKQSFFDDVNPYSSVSEKEPAFYYEADSFSTDTGMGVSTNVVGKNPVTEEPPTEQQDDEGPDIDIVVETTDKLASLKHAASEARARCDRLDEALQKSNSEIEEMLSCRKREKETLEGLIAEADIKFKSFEEASLRKKEKEALERMIGEARVRCESLEEALQKSKCGAKDMLASIESENEAMEKKIEEAKVQCESFEEALRKCESEAADMRLLHERERGALKKMMEETSSQCKSLKVTLKRIRATRTSEGKEQVLLEAKLRETNSLLQSLEEALKRTNSDASEMLALHERHKGAVERKIAELNTHKHTLEDLSKKSKSEAADLLLLRESEIKSLESKIAAATDQRDKLEGILKDSFFEAADALLSHGKEWEGLEMKIAQLRQNLREDAVSIKRQKRKAKSLRRAKAKAYKRLQTAEEAMREGEAELEAEVDQQQYEKEQLDLVLDAMRRDFRVLHDELEDREAALIAEREAQSDEKEQLDLVLDAMRRDFRDLHEELEARRCECERLKVSETIWRLRCASLGEEGQHRIFKAEGSDADVGSSQTDDTQQEPKEERAGPGPGAASVMSWFSSSPDVMP